MTVKPANLIYSVDDTPPLGATILLAVQHLLIAVIYLVYPVIVVAEAGGTQAEAGFCVQMSMLAIGLGTILQVRNRGLLGSGFLIPHVTTAAYLTPSFIAARVGGMALVLGMTMMAGIFEGILSRFMKKLRVLFPPEVSGVVVAMIGFSLAKAAILRLCGLSASDSVIEPAELMVGGVTLSAMVAFVVWSRGSFRLYSAAIGLAIGYGLAIAVGIFNSNSLDDIAAAPLIALPSWEHPGLSFDIYLIAPFLIGALASTVKASGVVINCQKVNDPDWKRADMVSVVFLPKFSVILTLMPPPVMGAGLLYVASYLIASGIQLIMTRMMDARRTFIVGLSFLAGISLEVVPALHQNLPAWAGSIFGSSLTVATMVAFTLNLIFRIGVSQKAGLLLSPQLDAGAEIYRFLENQGATWGARQQVIHEAKHILRELVEALYMHTKTNGPVHVEALFDEYNLNILVTYKGDPMEFPASPPTEDELMLDKSSLARMSGFMIRFMAEKVTATVHSNLCKVSIHITH